MTMGIYYDDPSNIKNPNDNRVSAGILFLEKNAQAENFFKLKGYKVKVLSIIISLYTQR